MLNIESEQERLVRACRSGLRFDKVRSMVTPFEVFLVENNDKFIFLFSAETLEQALQLAVQNGVGKYLVYSLLKRHKNFYEVTAEGKIISAAL